MGIQLKFSCTHLLNPASIILYAVVTCSYPSFAIPKNKTDEQRTSLFKNIRNNVRNRYDFIDHFGI